MHRIQAANPITHIQSSQNVQIMHLLNLISDQQYAVSPTKVVDHLRNSD